MAQSQLHDSEHSKIQSKHSPSILTSVHNYYNTRAPFYDTDSSHSFHLLLAREFITWAAPYLAPHPQPIHMLDLCCGTAMVSAAAVSHFGAANVVIDGVDISSASLRIARPKLAALGARATFWEGSVLDLDAVSDEVRRRKGSYHLITCCSAVVLLPGSYESLVASWSEYLAPGGVLIFDVPAPGSQPAAWLFWQALKALGLPVLGREDFAEGVEAVRGVIESPGKEKGLKAEEVFETRAYHTDDFGTEVWESKWDKMVGMGIPDLGGLSEKQREQAKMRFQELWVERAQADGGRVRAENRLVVGIASIAL